jgi:hypothetical protein
VNPAQPATAGPDAFQWCTLAIALAVLTVGGWSSYVQ